MYTEDTTIPPLVAASPIIPWLGGKRRLIERLLPLIPPHECYVELFCGGAALFFMRPMVARCEVINDLNGELVNLYRVVKNHPEEFARQFRFALSSRKVFEWNKITPPDTLTDVQRAARFYYLQHHSFGGRVANQNYGTETTGSMPNLMRIEESISAAHLRLDGVNIEHLPWHTCLARYDRPHTFFYADPPYWQTEGYGIDFPFEEYERMAKAMRTIKGKVMVSINDHPDIRRVFDGFTMHELDIAYSCGLAKDGAERKRSGELVITNWSGSGDLFG